LLAIGVNLERRAGRSVPWQTEMDAAQRRPGDPRPALQIWSAVVALGWNRRAAEDALVELGDRAPVARDQVCVAVSCSGRGDPRDVRHAAMVRARPSSKVQNARIQPAEREGPVPEPPTAIGDAVRAAREYLRAHPDDARYTDSAATARLEAGLLVRVEGPGGAALITDMPASVGGREEAPSPGWFLRAGHAACVTTLIGMRAAEEGVVLSRLEVVVESQSDDRGILDAADDIPAGPLSSSVRIVLAADGVPHDRLREIAEWGAVHCPVHDAVRRAVPVSVEVSVG